MANTNRCTECQKKVGIQIPGRCTECPSGTSQAMVKLCTKCRNNRCEVCKQDLTPPAPLPCLFEPTGPTGFGGC